MGETGRSIKLVDGKPVTVCTIHDEPLEWVQVEEGRAKFTCPSCLAGKRSAEPGPKTPLIKYGQTFFRDRELTPKERAHPPAKRSI